MLALDTLQTRMTMSLCNDSLSPTQGRRLVSFAVGLIVDSEYYCCYVEQFSSYPTEVRGALGGIAATHGFARPQRVFPHALF